VIFTELTPGFYTLQLLYSGFIDNSQDATECSSLSMEIAIVPSGHVNDVAHGFECPEHDIVPPTDLFTRHLNEQRLEPLHYWNDSLVVRGESSATHDRRRGIRPDIRVVAVYPLNLPLPQNRTKRVWTLRASLGYDFLTGGSLGFALLAQDVAVDTHPHDCTHAAGCILATNTRKNEKTIVTSLAGGEYSLVLFDALGDRQVAVSPCSPFSFDISIESIEEEENQINCMSTSLCELSRASYAPAHSSPIVGALSRCCSTNRNALAQLIQLSRLSVELGNDAHLWPLLLGPTITNRAVQSLCTSFRPKNAYYSCFLVLIDQSINDCSLQSPIRASCVSLSMSTRLTSISC